MSENKSYAGIDYFRYIAAFLIIAIHTSPLSSYSEMGDFILTRIIARVAVPFFLMTSGFFLISRYSYNADKIKGFVKKAALIYGISIVIYLPLNIYNGYFETDNLLPNIIKDIFFDGTLYHLWYLPASIIGALLAWYIVKRSGFRKALIITAALYVIGLLGDSYYGISEKLPIIKGLYNYIFEVSDYTRNGIFFAPVFFVLGGIISDKSNRISLKNSLIGLAVSFLLMLGEGMILHSFGLQRHDSMYIFLLPCMYFLFTALTFWKGHQKVLLRTSALLIYIIHPMMIVAVRIIAKILGMQSLIIENSMAHYLAVSIISATFSVLATLLFYKIKNSHVKFCLAYQDRSWIEIDSDNLKHNVTALQEAMPVGCELMAVVKAEAYGHGAFEVSAYLNKMGIKSFAVATIDEGIELRKYGIVGEILILGYTNPALAKELHKYDLTQTLINYDYSRLLNKQGYNIKAHIKIDTGMHRLGFEVADEADVLKVFKLNNLSICGIYTHLCIAESLKSSDVEFTHSQIDGFYDLLNHLSGQEVNPPKTHIQSSYGLLNYPELKCHWARIGIALYGVLSSKNDKTNRQPDLRPVLSLKSQIVLIKDIPKGASVGYDRQFIAERNSRIAILPIGYADGFPRSLSCGNGNVLIHGCRAPIIGRICMDQLTVDITDIPEADVGDIVTLIGKDEQAEISAEEVAENMDSITNELLSRMGSRLKMINRVDCQVNRLFF